MSINITKCTNTHNTTAKANRAIEWIVLHYTAGVTSKAGSAKNTAQYFATTATEASADYMVDDAEIVQYNPDPANRYTWAVGGSKYASMSTAEGGKNYGTAKNNNSVSIEMCSNKTNTKTLLVTDTDWYLTDATLENAAKLVKHLMELFGVDADHVIMHHHVTGKWCPQPWSRNEAALANWRAFKAKITTASSGAAATTPAAKTIHTVVAGDTLSKLASTYGTTVDRLVEINAIENKNVIHAGQVLMLSSTAEAAAAKLAAMGVISSPDYWTNAAVGGKLKYLDTLLIKAAAKISKAGTRTGTVEEGVAALVAAGVINTPDYWLTNQNALQYLGDLLRALGGAVK